jgi:hypothetical protein
MSDGSGFNLTKAEESIRTLHIDRNLKIIDIISNEDIERMIDRKLPYPCLHAQLLAGRDSDMNERMILGDG